MTHETESASNPTNRAGSPHADRRMATRRTALLVLVAAVAACAVTAGAMRHTSATFDEIVLVAGGLRGMALGRWDLVTGQPPLMMVAYGAAAATASPSLPSEERAWTVQQGWSYARMLFFQMGNDPQTLLGRARRVGVPVVGLLVVTAALCAGWVAGPVAGVAAAVMVAATPDVLAHGGVAYNDLPLALAFLLAVWAIDAALRRPSPLRGAGAGAAVALALGVKLSALALGPVALVLLAAEAAGGRRDRRAWLDLGVAAAVGALALFVGLVLLYRGDATLTLFRLGVWRTVMHAEAGHPEAAYLLGRTNADGWWFFYPVAFFFKTPLAFQVLLAAGAFGLVGAFRASGGAPRWRRLAGWRGRAPLVGALVFGGFLMRSHLDSGFRYALPVLPLLAIVAAAGLARVWRERGRWVRWAIGGLAALQIVSVATAYPHLLAYTSLWAGARDGAHRVLVDSSLDWGQGLLELRDFMSDQGVRRVRLSYFGSAMPEAYGIDYVPLPSFFRLEGGSPAGPPPRFTVISATTLHGLYLQGHDPFASYRERTPDLVLGHTLFVYDDGGASASTGPRSGPAPGP